MPLGATVRVYGISGCVWSKAGLCKAAPLLSTGRMKKVQSAWRAASTQPTITDKFLCNQRLLAEPPRVVRLRLPVTSSSWKYLAEVALGLMSQFAIQSVSCRKSKIYTLQLIVLLLLLLMFTSFILFGKK